jgi:hypothetical protein
VLLWERHVRDPILGRVLPQQRGSRGLFSQRGAARSPQNRVARRGVLQRARSNGILPFLSARVRRSPRQRFEHGTWSTPTVGNSSQACVAAAWWIYTRPGKVSRGDSTASPGSCRVARLRPEANR